MKEKKNATKLVASVEQKSTFANVIANVQSATNGLLHTANGTKKATIYKENLFVDTNKKQKKSMRKKLRNILFSICNSIANENKKENIEKLANAFNVFYAETYKINDYTLASVCNENLASEKKAILTKALEICKTFANK